MPDDDNNPIRDKDQDEHTQPGIPRPGRQPDQQQQPNAPPQPSHPPGPPNRGGILPHYGNPDLDPAGTNPTQRIDLREPNPLTPQGMLFDPRQLIQDQQTGRQPHPDYGRVPPGARFDPFGPPDPNTVGPGRGPMPGGNFGMPDPDHFQPPGVPQLPPRAGKNIKQPWPPGGGGFPPPGGAGGGPFI